MLPNLAFIGSALALFDSLKDPDLLNGIRIVGILRQPPNRIQNHVFLAH